jgi:soluble lytic murein transglycosylase-like protein
MRTRPTAILGSTVVAALVAVIALLIALTGSSQPPLPLPGIGRPPRAGDPFAYVSSREADFVARAVAGTDHVVYALSPGGVIATAARVARWRPLVNRAVAGTGIDPNLVEAIVFLESAGRPNVIAGVDPAAASGLTQILAQTGQSLLGMHIDLRRSRSLTGKIDIAYAEGHSALMARLQAERARIDGRFDPLTALRGTVRYLRLAEQRFNRLDLAVESYHMGIGNLQNVLDLYDGGQAVPYAQLFFDTSPDNHAPAYALLDSFSDDSRLYWWRILACEQIMRMYRTNRAALERLATLQNDADSNARVLHPPDQTPVFADPVSLRAGFARRAVLPLPSNPSALGLTYGPSMGELARRVGEPTRLYRGLRPAALDLLIELAARVRTLSGGTAPLEVAGSVTDKRYAALEGGAPVLSSAGWTFQIARMYASRVQAEAFQAMLDRLQELNVIAWTRTPDTIDVTVASDAGRVIVNGP